MRAAAVALCLAACSGPPPAVVGPQPRLRVSPSALVFGPVSAPATRTLLLSNAGAADSVLRIEATQLDSPDFTVMARGSDRLEVTAAPQSLGFKSAELIIPSNDPDGPARVPLTATAVEPAPCRLTLSPSIDFGAVLADEELPLAVMNFSDGRCDPVEVALEPGSHPAFSVTPTSLKLRPGERTTVTVRAALTDVWDVTLATGTLRIADARVALTATLEPSCLTVVPNDLDFGTVHADCSSLPRAIAVYNTCAVPVTVSSASLVGSPSFVFTWAPGFPATVMPGSTPLLLMVKYHPSGPGPESANLVLKSTPTDYLVTFRAVGETWSKVTDDFLQDEASPRTVFYLTSAAIDGTLEVSVEGIPTASGFHYDALLQAVVFDAAPAARASISISYSVPCL